MSFPSSTSSPPCQRTKTMPAKVANVSTPKNTPRTRARSSAVETLASIRAPYRRRSSGSCTKLCTVRICENASSATAVASATRSCTPVVIRRSRRPKNIVEPTTMGATASAVRVSRGWR